MIIAKEGKAPDTKRVTKRSGYIAELKKFLSSGKEWGVYELGEGEAQNATYVGLRQAALASGLYKQLKIKTIRGQITIIRQG